MNIKLPQQTILIIDDMPSDIKVVGEELRQEYNILVAPRGAKGLELAETHAPDLILLDVMMPEMDGYEVCRRLKQEPSTKNIPVIFLTSQDQSADELKGLQLGAVDYIAKPFYLPIVMARVKTHLWLKRKAEMLENMVSIDGLTDIPNRRRFDEYLDQEWKRATRSGSAISLIMMDIDCFKQFNDNYGHAAGDDCLKKVALMLENSLKRPADFVARYGGEEFAAILPETDLTSAQTLAETMRKNIESLNIPHAHSQVTDRVTLSLGAVSTIPESAQEAQDLLRGADKQLYIAKEQGRNQVCAI